MLCPLTPLFP
uniref:Uncharacterized protein MANES_18G102400 n=1 Tax=Rhizophora mucronata TaxID=61149 RepID=A0A2P2KV07_RHIMU